MLLDRGRRAVASDPDFSAIGACIRCGACMNACPVFRQVGGHGYGGVYPGPLGIVLLPLLGERDARRFEDLEYACSLCDACREACPVEIPLPDLIRRRREILVESGKLGLIGRAARSVARLAARPGLWRAALGTFRRTPRALLSLAPGGRQWNADRELPASLDHTFREWWDDTGAQAQTQVVACTSASAAGLAAASPPAAREVGDRAGELRCFGVSLRRAGGPIEIVQTKDVAAAIAGACRDTPAGQILCGDDVPEGWRPAASAAPDAEPRIGVTLAVAAVAATGSLLLAVPDRRSARPSLLCDTHVVVLPVAAPIYADPVSLWKAVEQGALGKGWLVQVTGPSRTADVEKILIIPAHGPRAMVVILEES